MKGVSETLAGRAYFVDVSGFTLEEVGTEHLNRLWLRGGLPRDYLAGTFMMRVLQPWFENVKKRQVKSPKVEALPLVQVADVCTSIHGKYQPETSHST